MGSSAHPRPITSLGSTTSLLHIERVLPALRHSMSLSRSFSCGQGFGEGTSPMWDDVRRRLERVRRENRVDLGLGLVNLLGCPMPPLRMGRSGRLELGGGVQRRHVRALGRFEVGKPCACVRAWG